MSFINSKAFGFLASLINPLVLTFRVPPHCLIQFTLHVLPGKLTPSRYAINSFPIGFGDATLVLAFMFY